LEGKSAPGKLSHVIFFFQLNKKPSRESRSEATHGKSIDFQFVHVLFIHLSSVSLPARYSLSTFPAPPRLPGSVRAERRAELPCPGPRGGAQAQGGAWGLWPQLVRRAEQALAAAAGPGRAPGAPSERSSRPRTLDLSFRFFTTTYSVSLHTGSCLYQEIGRGGSGFCRLALLHHWP